MVKCKQGDDEMVFSVPACYDSFRCIGSACRDNCCIGWEIDVDEETAKKYRSGTEKIYRQIQAGLVQQEEGTHFALTSDDRCVFLQDDGLCKIICALGDEGLCQICRDHPRFFHWYGNLKEGGLGLCCEEAARLWFSPEIPFAFSKREIPEINERSEPEDFSLLFSIRERFFAMMQEKEPLVCRLQKLLLAGAFLQHAWESGTLEKAAEADWTPLFRQQVRFRDSFGSIEEVISGQLQFYQQLTILDPAWKIRLEKAEEKSSAFQEMAAACLKENGVSFWLERVALYFLYRYFLESSFDGDLLSRVQLCVEFCLLLLLLYSLREAKEEAAVWISHLCSKELEYAQENMDALQEEFLFSEFFSQEALWQVLNSLE